jgi:hypothetical protein
MNHELRGWMAPLEPDASELNDLRHLRAAEGYAELGMYAEADDEIEKLNPTCRVFRLFLCSNLVSMLA